MNETYSTRKIAIVGGTGKEGKGLAYRWALSGHQVIIGSRTEEKALTAAKEINDIFPYTFPIMGKCNEIAVRDSKVVVLTIPFSAHKDMCLFLKPFLVGKMVIDVTVPLVPPKVTKVQMPSSGSAALETLEILGPEFHIGSAFHNISYERLLKGGEVNCDVLVCATDMETRKIILDLVGDAGLIGWDAGPLENSVIPEGLTSILIGINKQFGIQNAGIRITGITRV